MSHVSLGFWLSSKLNELTPIYNNFTNRCLKYTGNLKYSNSTVGEHNKILWLDTGYRLNTGSYIGVATLKE